MATTRFRIIAAHRKTGKVSTLILEAASQEEAENMTTAAGYMISRIEPDIPANQPPDPAPTPDIPPATSTTSTASTTSSAEDLRAIRAELSAIRANLDSLHRNRLLLAPRTTIAQGMLLFCLYMILIQAAIFAILLIIMLVTGIGASLLAR